MTSKAVSILVVDDQPANCELLEALLTVKGYDVDIAFSGEQALEMVDRQLPDLILLDIMMPGMNGFEVAARLKSAPETKCIPIIMITALEDRDSRLTGLEVGAEEFLSKPIDRSELWVRVRNLLRLKEYNDLLTDYNRQLKQEVEHQTLQLRGSYIDTILTMTRAAEHKDEDTGAHLNRMSFYAKHLAETLGMDSEFVENIYYASRMHDVGKIGIPDSILLKPGKHTMDEFEIMKTHSALGARILSGGTSPIMSMGAEIALGHHERWNGTGYPHRTAGDSIPLAARIVCLGDVYDALRSKRPYKPAFDHDTTHSIIVAGDDRTRPEHFDPDVLGVFKRTSHIFADIYSQHSDPH